MQKEKHFVTLAVCEIHYVSRWEKKENKNLMEHVWPEAQKGI